LVVLVCAFSIIYTWPRNIDKTYNGIKFNSGDPKIVEQVKINISGQYKKALFKREINFMGKITLGDKELDYTDWALVFNKYGMGILDHNESGNMQMYGNMFVSGVFKEISVEVFKKENNGASFNSGNGWFVSAPASDRKSAVEIANRLEQKLHRGIVIK
jgi:hypothetical protein